MTDLEKEDLRDRLARRRATLERMLLAKMPDVIIAQQRRMVQETEAQLKEEELCLK